MRKYSILLNVVLCCTLFIQSCTNRDSADNELDIYLLIGQSNMAGRAPVEGADNDTLQNVFLFTGIAENEWEKAANPLNKYSTIRKNMSMQKLGPGYHFAKTMAESDTPNPIGLVVNAKGGTKIELWEAGSTFYNEAVNRTKAAMEFGTLKGVLWHQGEANASKYNAYTPKIVALIEALRTDFNMPDLPVVVGQLSEDRVKRKDFNKMILQLPAVIDFVGVATTKGTSTIDSTHFDAASQQLLGRRYAQKMLEIQAKQN
ncbi:sialate O-acetylesterase [uncultured Draconibacterium sp.]|uniref:sialate O-acetylesterase n=1 Tax=uncultured Draconibacterium sp. TaxID=1573823 RepID=UPI002AA90059|nr:sialate O-acetylesterase [uncultured Draconibacterium sp.]